MNATLDAAKRAAERAAARADEARIALRVARRRFELLDARSDAAFERWQRLADAEDDA